MTSAADSKADPHQAAVGLVHDVLVGDLERDRVAELLGGLPGLQRIVGAHPHRHQAVGLQEQLGLVGAHPAGTGVALNELPRDRPGAPPRGSGSCSCRLAARRTPPLGVAGRMADGLDRIVDGVEDGDTRNLLAQAARGRPG